MADRSGQGKRRCGARSDGAGVDFVVRSGVATAVELCLFDDSGAESERLPLAREGDLWSLRLEGLGPGRLYGYRVHGPYAPDRGHRCNPAKLLVDPWARAVTGGLVWGPAVLGYDPDSGPQAASPSHLDSAAAVPKAVVIDPTFDWRNDRPPRARWQDTVIYEAHVRGLTRRHPELPPELRGTYLGLAHDAVVEHLVSLGVTAIQLLPVQHFVSERHLAGTGLANYWGYNPLAWFAPHAGYASGSLGGQVIEFKEMVRGLHAAGLEVLLDVVYNHTAEGAEEGATLGLRGLDNAAYYRSPDGQPGRSEDFTGCGNTLDFSRREVREIVLDSLRYWVEEMHVDGFRFDLAPVLGRDPRAFRPDAPLLHELTHDPVFEGIKLIAEPWDLGPDGYCLGRFPAGWAEWNDRYRDTVRRFWRGDSGTTAELTRRVTGSRDLFGDRGPTASVNYVAAHDGLTLADLVSYRRKDNRANLEDDRDGAVDDHSADWGTEARRARVQRTFLATLALSAGVPMLGHGDELGRTQRGNNNAYCQDNEISWVDWRLPPARRELLRFARRALELRREAGVAEEPGGAAEAPVWLDRQGDAIDPDRDPQGLDFLALYWPARAATDAASLLLLLNRGAEPCPFRLPQAAPAGHWAVRLDSSSPDGTGTGLADNHCIVQPQSLVLLACP